MEKWTAYTFVKNVYDLWMPTLLKKISSAIDDLPPEPDYESFHGSKAQVSKTSGHSQQLENQISAELPDSQLNHNDLQQITPDTSMQAEKPAPKKRKKKNKNEKI